ncbi:major facilitator superfamily domain-containing protein [Multifurca ochricompacta]|uniref:Major facilitator superfamily domain-containing protein n=1 Tax=Multifurca ochricompacta TaxID=376703 RepID=A0AAD4M7C7_9AGAM|nr:major facilitator superfamily domain-containing protein [Multifurca ochricompacta]
MHHSPQLSETDPLLPVQRLPKKPFYRPRPLWIVPFAMAAALVRGMTLAPRVQVYTRLSCNALHRHRYQHFDPSGNNLPLHLSPTSILASEYVTLAPIPVYFPHFEDNDPEGPRQHLSQGCLSDPAVQAGAARLQTVMVTVMGLLSACTTTWWGHYGQKHGRTKVLAASTLGLLLTDLTFVLTSTPSSPLSRHGHKFLLLAPIIEGLLGGQATLQAAISAYISDCTSDGSRAHIFSRFAGVSYVGLALGPTLGAFLIRHPLLQFQSFGRQPREMQSVAAVFWAAILCSTINFLSAVLVIPESLDKARQRAAQKGEGPTPVAQRKPGIKKRLLGPLSIFAPRRLMVNGRMRKDWSMSWLAIAVFGLFLASGVFQIKYLYAEHVFGWGAVQLGYYISFVSGVRALYTLLLMPFLLSTFKPSSPPPSASGSAPPSSPASGDFVRSVTFDLRVARASLLIDIVSHTLVALHISSSPLVFSGVTSISALASGATPALQSLAICILQRSRQGSPEIGALFGGLSMLTALGQTILAPLLFGLIYSSTVARFPEAVFALAAVLVLIALSATFFIRSEPPRGWKGKAPVDASRRVLGPERERGRSRVVKHIGDRVRKPVGAPVPASRDASEEASESTFPCLFPGSTDDAV